MGIRGSWPRSPLTRDVVASVVLTVLTQVELVLAGSRVDGPLGVQHVCFGLMTAAVALRRRAPLAAALVLALGMAGQTLAGDAPVVGGFLAMLVVVGSLGFHAPWRRGLVGLAAVMASALLYDVVADRFVVADFVGNAAIVAGTWALAHAVRRSTDARVAAEVAADRAATRAVQDERQRIARDLHDSVAHAVTLMTLQAGNARERTTDIAIQETLRSVEAGGRTALADMHRFLQVLGPDGRSEAPGLQDLDDMVEQVRAGGMSVELVRAGDLEGLPSSISSTAYRVVQEALTNAVKHSSATHATLTVHSDGRHLLVDVTNTAGAPSATGARSGAGRGLAGLRERLALFQGGLEAGHTQDGQWRVTARIPLDEAAPS